MRGVRDRFTTAALVLGILAAAASIASLLEVPSAVASRAGTTENDTVSFVRGASVFDVSLDGTRISRVLRGTGSGKIESQVWYYDPAWSNDGRRLAVTVLTYPTGGHGYADVAVVRPPKRPLSVPGGASAVSGSPSWAPDNRRLVLVGYQFSDLGGGLYISRPGSKSNVELTLEDFDPSGVHDNTPAWSPDGSSIAFARTQNNRQTRLYLIRPNRSGLKRLTNSRAENPSWSPDSKRLVFDDGRRIIVVDADGANFKYLTDPTELAADPAWSPDGRMIAYVQYRSRDSQTGDIMLINLIDGSSRLLVRNATEPAWKPG